MASRFRQRLFQPWSGPRAPAVAQPPEAVAKRKISFQASIAEFLLVNRARAAAPHLRPTCWSVPRALCL
jgi:hypothetical protein